MLAQKKYYLYNSGHALSQPRERATAAATAPTPATAAAAATTTTATTTCTVGDVSTAAASRQRGYRSHGQ